MLAGIDQVVTHDATSMITSTVTRIAEGDPLGLVIFENAVKYFA